MQYRRPHRIGHGILSARDPRLMERVAEAGIVLEVCPTSNLRTRAIRDLDELHHILTTLRAHGVRLTINTDGPQMLSTTLVREYRLLLEAGIFTHTDLCQGIVAPHQASIVCPMLFQPQKL